VDELLNFIDGEGQRDAASKAKQKKKKTKKRGGKAPAAEDHGGEENTEEADASRSVGAALQRMRVG
jgi:hypothetical protein